MSAQLARLTGCGLFGVAALLAAVSPAVAEPIYTVTDQGITSDSILDSGDSSMSVITQRRLKVDPEGKVEVGTWASPGDYSGPLPDSLKSGAYGVSAVATSQAGENAAGWGYDQDHAWAGFADIHGEATAVGNLPDQTWSQALGVNQSGQVVGMSGNMTDTQAFLYTPDQGIKGLGLGPDGAGTTGSAAYAINDSGQIVGELARGNAQASRAFTSFNTGPLVDLNQLVDPSLGWTVTRAMDINALGQIAAFGLDSLDVMHALLLTPTVPVDSVSLAAAATTANDTENETTLPTPSGGGLGTPHPVPEPSALAFFGLVTAGLVARRGRGCRRPR